MKKVFKRIILIAVILCMALTTLAGCETGDNSEKVPPLTQTEINEKSTSAVIAAGMGMLVNGSSTEAQAEIKMTNASTKAEMFSLKKVKLQISGSKDAALSDVNVRFSGELAISEVGGSTFALTLADGVLFVEAATYKVKATSASINNLFSTLLGFIVTGDAATALSSVASVGDISIQDIVGDCTYTESGNTVNITLPVRLETIDASLKGKELKLTVELNKNGELFSFKKINIDQTIGDFSIFANIPFATPTFTEISAPADADAYADFTPMFSLVDQDLINAIIKTAQRRSFDLSADVSFVLIQKNASGEETYNYPLISLGLGAQIERTENEGTKALVNAEIGGLASMLLSPLQTIYFPMASDPYVYLTESKTDFGSDEITEIIKQKMLPTDYLASLSSMSSMLPLMQAVTGLDFTLNTDIVKALTFIKNVEKTVDENGITFKINLDMLKLLPGNEGKNAFTDQWLELKIGADGILKSFTGKIATLAAMEEEGTQIVMLDISVVLNKTEGVVVTAPEGFDKADYPILAPII